MGPKGTWTPFHADVFRSYSWSANICGRKKWILFSPGQEEFLKDCHGNLIYSVTSPDFYDKTKYPSAEKARAITVIQEEGEIIFVPSGWHHQVLNMEDTISINHNWANACNIDWMWNHLTSELIKVEKSISDCDDMEGWHQQCQMILKACLGIDFTEFLRMLTTIAKPRIQALGHVFQDMFSNLKPIQRSCVCRYNATAESKSVSDTGDACKHILKKSEVVDSSVNMKDVSYGSCSQVTKRSGDFEQVRYLPRSGDEKVDNSEAVFEQKPNSDLLFIRSRTNRVGDVSAETNCLSASVHSKSACHLQEVPCPSSHTDVVHDSCFCCKRKKLTEFCDVNLLSYDLFKIEVVLDHLKNSQVFSTLTEDRASEELDFLLEGIRSVLLKAKTFTENKNLLHA